MKVVEVKHPLVKHKLGLMREADISTKRFRELAKEVGSLLTYEATADFETEKVTIDGWNGPVEVDQNQREKGHGSAYSACWFGHDGRCSGTYAKCTCECGRYLS